MREWEIGFLRMLRDASDEGIVQSGIAKRCHSIVNALRACGAADYLPASSGRGIRLRIKNIASFERFVDSRCPSGLDFDPDEIQSHSDAILHLADAKAFSRSIAEGVLVRATKPNIVIESSESDAVVPVSALTETTGCAAIQLSDSKSWMFHGSIAVVENADAFWKHEQVIPDVDLVVFASGRMSGRLLQWLATKQMAANQILHWGDYDPVGVSEFVRLSKQCGDRVQTFVPDSLELLLKRHGKRKLVTGQVEILTRLRGYASDIHVARMIGLFDQHRRGLEQEILLDNSSLRTQT